jgi:hypothetical protein
VLLVPTSPARLLLALEDERGTHLVDGAPDVPTQMLWMFGVRGELLDSANPLFELVGRQVSPASQQIVELGQAAAGPRASTPR